MANVAFFGKTIDLASRQAVVADFEKSKTLEVASSEGYSSTGDYLKSMFGSRSAEQAFNVSEVVGKKAASIAVSVPLLKLQMHEQIGRRYLFEIKLSQLLQQGAHVDAEEAKNFLVGLLESGKFTHLPEALKEKAKELSQVAVVQQAFAGEPKSVFNPKPHGFDLNLNFRPS